MADNLSNDDNPSAGTPNGGITSPGTETKVSSTAVSGTGKKTSANLTKIRRDNPLSKLSSYTYNITLYAVTPKKLNEYFAAYDTGSTFTVNQDGFFIVAQSGGVGANENRAITLDGIPGAKPGYDYYIDDLSIRTIMPTKDSSRTATADMEFRFKIVEPTGFNFLFQLSAATDIISNSENIPISARPNQYQHNYLLGIRFYGYDVDGNLQTASNLAFDDKQSGLTDSYAVYERFFPIQLTKVDFKLDGRATIYNVEAVPNVIQTAFASKRGILKTNTNIIGSTVGEMLGKSLTEVLNNVQQKELSAEDRDQYVIEFEKNSRIAAAKIINPNSVGNNNAPAPTSQIKTTSQSNVAASARSQTINVNAATSNISTKPVTQIIDNIITSSEFISKTLKESATSQIESDANENSSSVNDKFNWYVIIPKAEILRRSEKTKDWVYKITYFIKEYAVPYIRNPYVNKTTEFYGAVKKYDYWYTGENTEIKSLNFSYNTLFYNIVPILTNKDKSAFDGSQGDTVPVAYQNSNNADLSGSVVDNKGLVYNQNVNASIYNNTDNNVMKFTILGDPDFLMTTIATPITTSKAFKEFYGPGLTVNPMDGSIFVQINFKSAYDYDNTGLLQLAKSVHFYTEKYRAALEAADIKGLIMEVTHCVSTFSRGSFLQELEGILLDESVLAQKLGVTINNAAMSQRKDTATAQTNTIAGSGSGAGRGRQGGATAKEFNEYLKSKQAKTGFGNIPYPVTNTKILQVDPRQAATNPSLLGSIKYSPDPSKVLGKKEIIGIKPSLAPSDDAAVRTYSVPDPSQSRSVPDPTSLTVNERLGNSRFIRSLLQK